MTHNGFTRLDSNQPMTQNEFLKFDFSRLTTQSFQNFDSNQLTTLKTFQKLDLNQPMTLWIYSFPVSYDLFGGIQLYCWPSWPFLGFPSVDFMWPFWAFDSSAFPDQLIWFSSWLKQYLGDLNLFNSWLKMLPNFSIQFNSWLKRKIFDSESSHDSTLSQTHIWLSEWGNCELPVHDIDNGSDGAAGPHARRRAELSRDLRRSEAWVDAKEKRKMKSWLCRLLYRMNVTCFVFSPCVHSPYANAYLDYTTDCNFDACRPMGDGGWRFPDRSPYGNSVNP